MYEWKTYVSADERRRQAERHAASLKKKGHALSPIIARRGAIAKTFWGKSWCDNLEGYSDYSNRLPRGRTYCRNGSVIDLRLSSGAVQAEVMGSRLYRVTMTIAPIAKLQWESIGSDCSGSIDSLVGLLQGRLSPAVMERICRKGVGLFPALREIKFHCSCPDSAAMCKHVAAVLYGIGVRLDAEPELLFLLRKVDVHELLAGAALRSPLGAHKVPRNAKLLDASKLADVFGIELAEAGVPAAPTPKAEPKLTGKKTSRRKVAGEVRGPHAR